MHLYALDKNENLILASEADKQTNYFCCECGSVVRCRGGFLRQIHFYHLELNRLCRQSGKSLEHLQVQRHLQDVFKSECKLEQRFPSINRIADVVWEPKKIIFEIQCSSITAREIEERNRDYYSLGYRVIWILHDRLYNRTRLTAAEYFLQEHPHYFTDINSEGKGYIYDSWNVVEKGKKIVTLGKREIKIVSYCDCQASLFTNKNYPKWLLKRMQSWPIYFSGDYLDYILTSDTDQINIFLLDMAYKTKGMNEDFCPQGGLWNKLQKVMYFITFPYRLTLYLFLDKLTR